MTSPVSRRQRLAALVSAGETCLVDPPVLLLASDYFDLAGEEFGRRLLLTEGADGRQYCLRPDFTLPIARHHLSLSDPGPASYGYLGPVFRQRAAGPEEFVHAGLELRGHDDADRALARVFEFLADAMAIHDIRRPDLRLGSIAVFEQLLEELDMPAVWRPRLRRRFGNRAAMDALLERLSEPQDETEIRAVPDRKQLVTDISASLRADGFGLTLGRTPEEIADRYLEKLALSRARVPARSVRTLQRYLDMSGPLDEVQADIRKLIGTPGRELLLALDVLERNAAELAARFAGAPLRFEAAFSPQLHYYTGLVFEVRVPGGDVLGSGGQYDRLMQALGAGNKIAASGCALWVDRLQQEAGI